MRITCPNCGAQYEVDDALIPETGRDVQCSNCGKGWFQPKQAEPALAEETDAAEAPEAAAGAADQGDSPSDAEDTPEDSEPPVRDAEPEAAAVDEEESGPSPHEDTRPAAEEAEEVEEAPAVAPVPPVPPRRPDESVLAVLREEAERELAQRRQESGAIESQPDLGLAEPPSRRTGPSEAEIAAGAAVAASARRDLLPDIDEINSTLRPDAGRLAGDGAEAEPSVEDGRRRGFRLGFGLMLLVAALLIGLYIAAGPLAAAVPALEPVLAAYVEAANGVRAWIDGLLARGVDAMSG
jgi:predicted Zn finger-like uncharacterized protein